MQGVGDGVGAVLHAKLGQDGLDVVANRFGADVQLGRDLRVAAPGGKQVEHLALTAGQRVGVRQLVGWARRAAALAPRSRTRGNSKFAAIQQRVADFRRFSQ